MIDMDEAFVDTKVHWTVKYLANSSGVSISKTFSGELSLNEILTSIPFDARIVKVTLESNDLYDLTKPAKAIVEQKK